MADTSQGPGWWQASDGKWYAPELHENAQPPPPTITDTPPGPGYWKASDGKWYPPELHPRSEVSSPTAPIQSAPTDSSISQGRASLQSWVLLGSGIVLALGSLLPWVTASTVFGSISKDGTSGDGVITLICAAIIVILAIMMLRRNVAMGWTVGGGIVSVVALGVSVYDASTLPLGNQYASVQVGFGLWLCIIASVVATGVVGMVFIQNRKAQSVVAQ